MVHLIRSFLEEIQRRKQHRTDHVAPEFHQQHVTIDKSSSPAPPSHSGIDPTVLVQSASANLFPDGVKILHDCHDAKFDVCFIHGLSGNRTGTWTARGQSRPWPETLLPPKLDGARILTYGYDAYILQKSDRSISINGLADHATNLLNDLSAERADSNTSARPLVFIAHSLGGLVCKEAILLSRSNPEPHLRSIFDYVKGIIFLGTPHRGSWMADWARIPASALGVIKPTNSSLLKILRSDNKYLHSVQERFFSMVREQQKAGRDLEITCFFEELPLPLAGIVVSRDSATLEGYNAISIHADHRNMVKFSSVDDNGFKRLLGELTRWKSQVLNSATSQQGRSVEAAGIEKMHDLSFRNFGPGDQYNVPGGTLNICKGDGNQFPGASFHGFLQFT